MAKTKEEKQEDKRIRRIIMIIIAIIIILLLLRSCSSEFNWTIGRLFGTSSKHEITDTDNDKPVILNQNLKFDIEEKENITVTDDEYKLGFSFENINPKEFTCTTSDASLATCYVKDGYVVVNPKGNGKVTVYLQTNANDKVFQASTTINVSIPDGTLNLSSNNGTIVLSKTNKKILTYNINNIKGEVTASSSNENVAIVNISDGVVTITAKKTGKTTITLTVTDERTGKTYRVSYELNVVDKSGDITTDQKEENNKPSKPDNDKPSKPEIVKDNNNYLEYIKVSTSKLLPEFNKEVLNYNVTVNDNVDSIGFLIKKESSKAKVKYIYNGKEIKSTSEISLNTGDNLLKIEVTSEKGETKTYTVIITRKEKEVTYSNYLKELEITGYKLNPLFDKNNSNYNLNVKYNQNTINLKYLLEDNSSNISFKLNNNKINDLSNINLQDGDNILEIKVTDKLGNDRIYIINIHKPVRTIELYNNINEIYIEQSPYYINYKITEDNIEINDYDINDIEVELNNFNGTYQVYKGYIKINPSYSDANKNYDLKIKYNDTTASTKLKIKTKDYYINTPTLNYDISYVNGNGNKNIIIDNNILVGEITKTNLSNGFRLSTPNGAYIDIITNDNLIDINFDNLNSSNNSLVISVIAKSIGTSTITVKGNIMDSQINEYTINFNIVEKYNIVLDANGGFFDAFSNKYTYLVSKNDVIRLNDFKALKVDDEANCLFFKLDSFNTKKDGTGTKYNIDETLTNFTSDMTIYAIYKVTSEYQTLSQSERLYLTEVDLFHNEEYYQKYNKDKIIYPGSEGAHVMSITNSGTGKIKITKINLEEDTICISERKCINIGYTIKSALDVNDPYTYFYGTKNSYQILNKDNNTMYTTGTLTDYHTTNNINLNPNIELEVGETKEISILWKWVPEDDSLDTYIGSNYSTLGDTYTLTVSIDFERENNTCIVP